jgi:hypothetical protein
LCFSSPLNGIIVEGRARIFNFLCQQSTSKLLFEGTCDMVDYSSFYHLLGKLFTILFRFIGHNHKFYLFRSIDHLSDAAGVNHKCFCIVIIYMHDRVFHIREECVTICMTTDKASMCRHVKVYWKLSKIQQLLNPRELHELP